MKFLLFMVIANLLSLGSGVELPMDRINRSRLQAFNVVMFRR
jgi:hypothetical protein